MLGGGSPAAGGVVPSDAIGSVATAGGGGITSLSSEEDTKSAARVEEGDRLMGYTSGNRWPRQETLALLQIRSDMDAAFRDSSHKSALWEEVSRKLGDLGYRRTPKKCKEKFENVYKYHKRTKDGRTGKSEGKNYRFFQQLEAFESVQSLASQSPIPSPTPLSSRPPFRPPHSDHVEATTVSLQWSHNLPNVSHVTVPSTTNPTHLPPQSMYPYSLFQHVPSTRFTSSTSSSTASLEGLRGGGGRKRKWKGFFYRLAKDVAKKQEELQRLLFEGLERHERERTIRDEAWRAQEMARMNREYEVLAQERSAAAAKDAAIITFLQKMSGEEGNGRTHANTSMPPPPPPPPQPQPQPQKPQPTNETSMELDVLSVGASSSRWPKAEVQALITIRTNLDVKYNQNGPKGPLWEEISSEMAKLGYKRNAKRCKQKWENINKYFKKVKESSKKRPEDSKTCPYFHLLDALHKDKCKSVDGNPMEPLAVQTEQRWPPLGPVQGHQPQIVGAGEHTGEHGDEEMEQVYSEEDNDDDDNEHEEAPPL